jgi:hypothetical protein
VYVYLPPQYFQKAYAANVALQELDATAPQA